MPLISLGHWVRVVPLDISIQKVMAQDFALLIDSGHLLKSQGLVLVKG